MLAAVGANQKPLPMPDIANLAWACVMQVHADDLGAATDEANLDVPIGNHQVLYIRPPTAIVGVVCPLIALRRKELEIKKGANAERGQSFLNKHLAWSMLTATRACQVS